jgi:hypothetical protein
MSRKWERMVERNSRQLNKKREKTGQRPLATGAEMVKFQGKSIYLPLLLISVSVLFFLFYGQAGERDGLFWFTVISYALLGLYFFFLRKPYLKVGRSEIASRRWGREKFVKAQDIEQIYIQPNEIIITIRGERNSWVFSRFVNFFDISAMAEALKDFARRHAVPLYVKQNQLQK